MAHFAKIGLNNEVIGMSAVATRDCMTEGGIEREEIGLTFLQNLTGHQTWKKCSYNTKGGIHYNSETGEVSADQTKAFRANYPSVGWFYDSENDIFHKPRPTDRNGNPCNSWTLNTTTGRWECPLGDAPYNNNSTYLWDESVYQSDNTQGWILQE